LDQNPLKNVLARIWGPRGEEHPTGQRDATILVVDDSRTVVVALQRMLESAGYLTLPAFDGVQAVETALRHLPDLILMDIVMPRMNGFEATRALATHPKTRHIPVIMVSANDQVSDRVWGTRLGAKAFMAKPIAKDLLVARVGSVLAVARRMQSAAERVHDDSGFFTTPRPDKPR